MDQENKNSRRTDLNDTVKDFGTGVEFEEYRAPRSYYPGTSKITRWVIKYFGGLVKDEKQANYVLLGFVAVAVIISLFLIFGSDRPTTSLRDKTEEYYYEYVP